MLATRDPIAARPCLVALSRAAGTTRRDSQRRSTTRRTQTTTVQEGRSAKKIERLVSARPAGVQLAPSLAERGVGFAIDRLMSGALPSLRWTRVGQAGPSSGTSPENDRLVLRRMSL
jgi:hypothetical protein